MRCLTLRPCFLVLTLLGLSTVPAPARAAWTADDVTVVQTITQTATTPGSGYGTVLGADRGSVSASSSCIIGVNSGTTATINKILGRRYFNPDPAPVPMDVAVAVDVEANAHASSIPGESWSATGTATASPVEIGMPQNAKAPVAKATAKNGGPYDVRDQHGLIVIATVRVNGTILKANLKASTTASSTPNNVNGGASATAVATVYYTDILP